MSLSQFVRKKEEIYLSQTISIIIKQEKHNIRVSS